MLGSRARLLLARERQGCNLAASTMPWSVTRKCPLSRGTLGMRQAILGIKPACQASYLVPHSCQLRSPQQMVQWKSGPGNHSWGPNDQPALPACHTSELRAAEQLAQVCPAHCTHLPCALTCQEHRARVEQTPSLHHGVGATTLLRLLLLPPLTAPNLVWPEPTIPAC